MYLHLNKKRCFKIITLALSLSAVIIICEFGFRSALKMRFDIQASDWSHPLFKMEPHSTVEYTLHPNVSLENRVSPDHSLTWACTTNGDGFRGKQIPHQKQVNERRIVFFGDSYTFGWAVNDHETYPEQLEKILNNQNPELKYTCVNMAVPGYNTVQQSGLVERILQYDPDLVVLSFIMNDAEPQKSVIADPDKTYQYASSWLFEYMKLQLNHLLFSGRPRLPVNLQQYNAEYLDGFQPSSPKWKDSKEAFEKIVVFLASKQIPAAAIIIPDFTRPFDDSYPFKMIHETVAEWFFEFHIEAIDLYPHFRGQDHLKYRVEIDNHPNAEAHHRIARILFAEMSGFDRL